MTNYLSSCEHILTADKRLNKRGLAFCPFDRAIKSNYTKSTADARGNTSNYGNIVTFLGFRRIKAAFMVFL